MDQRCPECQRPIAFTIGIGCGWAAMAGPLGYRYWWPETFRHRKADCHAACVQIAQGRSRAISRRAALKWLREAGIVIHRVTFMPVTD